jgi:hypothetical protein
MAYFEMDFSERKNKELPRNFDPYVYNEMHTWLRHKPKMNPPHFRDLLNPTDGNFEPPTGGFENFNSRGQDSREEPTLHAYSAAAFDATADSLSEYDHIPEEVDGSAGINNTAEAFPSPPPNTSSAVHLR